MLQDSTLEEEYQHMTSRRKVKAFISFVPFIRARKQTWLNSRWERLFEARRHLSKTWKHTPEKKTPGFPTGFAQSFKGSSKNRGGAE